jgi:O-antigen/teichoic acid export membrane protein
MNAWSIFKSGGIVGVGVLVAQFINILAYPILARLFSPADFGSFALFFFGMQVLGAALAGRYEQAIMLCKTRTRARHALFLAQIIAVIATSSFVLLFGLLNELLDTATGAKLGLYWMFVPIAGFFISIQTSLTFMSIRLGYFARVSGARIIKSAAAFLIQLALVYSIWGGVGVLIVGETLGAALSILPLLGACTPSSRPFGLTRVGRRYLFGLALFYLDQPKWNLPHVVLSQLARWVIAAFITTYYTTAEAGAYFMMFRVVMMPSTLVAGALSQVYFKAASEEQRKSGLFRDALRAVVVPLLLLGLVAVIVLMLFGPKLFVLVLGGQWEAAGVMSVIFAPYILLQMVLATVAPSYILGGRQKAMLAIAFGQSSVFILGFLLGRAIGDSVYWAIGVSVWLSIPYMSLMLYWYWRLSIGAGSSADRS